MTSVRIETLLPSTYPSEAALTPNDPSTSFPSSVPSFCLKADIDDQERTYPLHQGSNLLGASKSCDVVLSVKGVSRRHAVVHVDGDTVRVEDQESRNGTYVDGSRVSTSPLVASQTLRLGPLALRLEPLDPDDGKLGLALDLSAHTPQASAFFQTSHLHEPPTFEAGRLRLITAVLHYLTLPEPDVPAALARVVAGLGAEGAAWIETPGTGLSAAVLASVGSLGALPESSALQGLKPDRHDPSCFSRQGPGEIGILQRPEGSIPQGLWLWFDPAPDHPTLDPAESGPILNVILHMLRRLGAGGLEAISADAEQTESPSGLAFPEGVLPGRSPSMVSLYQQMRRLADGKMPILVLGETGVGKEHLALTMHRSSERAPGPFVAINCAAIPDELLEAEMFGIGKGVATGVQERDGKFQQASGGTLFLDEIGDMPLSLQAKLLRTLQDGQVHPVGKPPVQVDVRIVAATHTNLHQRIEDGQFRADLYYRLAGYELEVPPLRRRTEDIPGLIAHFMRKFTAEAEKRIPGMSIKALRALTAYGWPGNVRELEHEVRRLVYLSPPGQAVDSAMLSSRVLSREGAGSATQLDERGLDERLASLEEQLIRTALTQTAGNQTRAAEVLQISRGGLIKRMKRLEIDPKGF